MDELQAWVSSKRPQFFHNRLLFSSQAKLRSTTQRCGMTLKVRSSLRLGDMHRDMLAQDLAHTRRKGLADVTAISQQPLLHLAQVEFALSEHL